MADPSEKDLMEFEAHRKNSFADNFSFGMPIGQALQAAGYSTKNLTLGYSLLRDSAVQEQINLNREWLKTKLIENTDTVLQQLQRDRDFAYDCANPSAAIQATNSIAKVLGLLDTDKSGKIPAKITIEWSGGDDVLDMVK